MNDPQSEGQMASYIRRRKFLATLGGVAAVWPLAARAQPDRVRRIGFLTTLSESDSEVKGWLTAFQAEMQKLGWTLGRNFSMEDRWPGSNEQRLRSLRRIAPSLSIELTFVGVRTPEQFDAAFSEI